MMTALNIGALVVVMLAMFFMLFTMFDPQSKKYPLWIVLSMRGSIYSLGVASLIAIVIALEKPSRIENIILMAWFGVVMVVVAIFHEFVLKLGRKV